MAISYKATINGTEYVVEGDDAREAMERFVELTKLLQGSDAEAPRLERQDAKAAEKKPRAAPDADVEAPEPPAVGLSPDLLQRAFKKQARERVNLLLRGGDDLETMLLVLYGALAVDGDAAMTAPSFLKESKRFEVKERRSDNFMKTHGDKVDSWGARRGKRYQLNAEGVRFCEDLIRAKAERGEMEEERGPQVARE